MGRSCKEVARSLFECMKQTECVKNGGDMRECMAKNKECNELRTTYTLCRKEALDMRTRIRGNKHF